MLTSTSPFVRQLVLSLLALPPLFLTVYILAGFPYPPNPPVIHSSLASLPPSCPSWSVYPEDYYQGGSYVMLPHGRVSHRSPPLTVRSSSPRTDEILAHWSKRRPAGSSIPASRYTYSYHSLILQVVLIHGLSIPAIVWKDVAPVLASRGYRVLLYGNTTCTLHALT